MRSPDRADRAARAIRCVIASRNAYFSSCRSVLAAPVWTYVEAIVRADPVRREGAVCPFPRDHDRAARAAA
jgi:hypothetical protein